MVLKVRFPEQQQQQQLRTCWSYRFLGCIPALLNQTGWEWSPAICVLTSFPGNSDVWNLGTTSFYIASMWQKEDRYQRVKEGMGSKKRRQLEWSLSPVRSDLISWCCGWRVLIQDFWILLFQNYLDVHLVIHYFVNALVQCYYICGSLDSLIRKKILSVEKNHFI